MWELHYFPLNDKYGYTIGTPIEYIFFCQYMYVLKGRYFKQVNRSRRYEAIVEEILNLTSKNK